jgi:ankyrin repeat protein
MENTVLHLAVRKSNAELLEKLWEMAKENLTAEELSNKLLITKDPRERTACQESSDQGKREILQKLWERTEENLRAELFNSKFLLAEDNLGPTVCHRAAR